VPGVLPGCPGVLQVQVSSLHWLPLPASGVLGGHDHQTATLKSRLMAGTFRAPERRAFTGARSGRHSSPAIDLGSVIRPLGIRESTESCICSPLGLCSGGCIPQQGRSQVPMLVANWLSGPFGTGWIALRMPKDNQCCGCGQSVADGKKASIVKPWKRTAEKVNHAGSRTYW